jgi:hypothetical protein
VTFTSVVSSAGRATAAVPVGIDAIAAAAADEKDEMGTGPFSGAGNGVCPRFRGAAGESDDESGSDDLQEDLP